MDKELAKLILDLAALQEVSLSKVYDFLEEASIEIEPISIELAKELGTTTIFHWTTIYYALGHKDEV